MIIKISFFLREERISSRSDSCFNPICKKGLRRDTNMGAAASTSTFKFISTQSIWCMSIQTIQPQPQRTRTGDVRWNSESAWGHRLQEMLWINKCLHASSAQGNACKRRNLSEGCCKRVLSSGLWTNPSSPIANKNPDQYLCPSVCFSPFITLS